jgi:hypothetical protein
LKEKFERDLSNADEKRKVSREHKMQKLREHIAKVEVVRKEQAFKRKESTEYMKENLSKKLDLAAQKKQEQLEQVINTAQKSA